MSEANGVSENRIAEALQEDATVGYRPQIPLEAMWLSGSEMPQITLRRDLEFMQLHPTVINALEYYRSGIAGAEFWGGPDSANPKNEEGKPISPDPRVAQFVLAHAERFWNIGVPQLQEGGYPHGWAPGEHLYKEVQGMLVWSHLKAFHPNDGYMLTSGHQPIGARIRNVRDKQPVDLWFAEGHIPAKACWYAHRSRFSSYYGRSQLLGAWRPWRRLGWKDAVEQVLDAAVYRAGYKGPTVRYPPGHSAPTAQAGVPATRADGGGLPRRENRDVARQIGEWAKAGATFSLSSETYSGTSIQKWGIDWPDHVMDVRPLIDVAKYLEDQILLGIGVPPELVKAGGTGSGYSGRSIPREAFLDGQQRVADAFLQMFVEQVIKPLVLWNFGDVPFALQCKSLLQSQAEDKQGDQQQDGAAGAQDGGAPPKADQPPAPAPAPTPAPAAPQTAALSLERHGAALAIVKRVMARRVA